jgi:hypothetical protein
MDYPEFEQQVTALGWEPYQFAAYIRLTGRGLRRWRQFGVPYYAVVILRLLHLLKRRDAEITPANLEATVAEDRCYQERESAMKLKAR